MTWAFNCCHENKISSDYSKSFIYVSLIDTEKNRKDSNLQKNGILFSIYTLNK